METDVGGVEGESPLLPAEIVHDSRMGDHDPLRLAGRPRGVHHVHSRFRRDVGEVILRSIAEIRSLGIDDGNSFRPTAGSVMGVDDRGELRIVDDERQTRRRCLPVERHPSGPAPKHGEHGDGRVDRSGQRYADPIATPDAQATEPRRQPRRTLLKGVVGDLRFPLAHRAGGWRPRGLLLHELMKRRRASQIDLCLVELLDHPSSIRVGQHRHLLDRNCRPSCCLGKKRRVPRRESGNDVCVITIGRELERSLQAVGTDLKGERKIEAGPASINGLRPERGGADPPGPIPRLDDGEEDIDEGLAAALARRHRRGHDLVEGEIGMVERAEEDSLHTLRESLQGEGVC